MSVENLAQKQGANLETLRAALPDYARDIKLNLSSVLKAGPDLSQERVWGIALAAACAARHPAVIAALEGEAAGKITEAEVNAARAAATVMAMNNVYYRFIHLAGDEDLRQMPAGLRMNIIGDPGIDKTTFELYALAVSAINGCGLCIESHTTAVLEHGTSRAGVQHCVKIAAVVFAAAQALSI